VTEADAIRLAREVADRDKVDPYAGDMITLTPAELVRLAAKVRAKAREDAAKVCEEASGGSGGRGWNQCVQWCAAAIRGML
jgi:hypothetical protein